MKKIPMRRCLATNQSFPKKEMLRIVRTPEGEVKVDTTGKLNGKGAYLSKTEEALAVIRKKDALRRALEVEIPEETMDAIDREIASLGADESTGTK